MKPKLIHTIIVLTGFLFIVNNSPAQNSFKNKSAKVTVLGTSTIHDWESDVTKVECTGQFKIQNSQLAEIGDVVVKIPVESIKSTKGKIMDSKTYEAFDYKKNPNIQYKLTSARISGNGPEYSVTTTGTLTMAGTSVSTELSAKAKVLPNGDLQIIGSKALNMKNFKMEPPTAMMGAIKVGEEVTVKFDITLTPQ